MVNTGEKVRSRRDEINAIDNEILELLNRWAAIALSVGAVKSRDDAALCDHGREREVLARLVEKNEGPLDEQGVRHIFQRIIDESLHLQQRAYQKTARDEEGNIKNLNAAARVAFLGERGTFSEEAALAVLGNDCETVSCPSFDDLFQAIDSGFAEYILTPLENSRIGPINRCYDLLLSGSLNIAAEVILPVEQHLIGCPEATLESIQTVESHPAALGQCEMFLSDRPYLVRLEAADTAGSVRRAVESRNPTRAAIGSRRAAELYGAKIIQNNIEDQAENFTRFALLSSGPGESTVGQKVSIAVRLKHEPGALHNALRPFVRRGINLLKFESRPVIDAPWEYSFYFDLQVPASESELSGALDEIRELSVEFRNLGRYPTIDLTERNGPVNRERQARQEQ